MVSAKKDTPAEQLLRMIEGPHLVGALQGWPGRLWSRFRIGRREPDPFLAHLRLAQQLLWVILVALGAYVVVDLMAVRSTPRLPRAPASGEPEAADQAAGVAASSLLNSLRPLADYLAAVQQANPFGGAAAIVAAPMVQSTKERLEELAQGLVVVGIDRSATPEAIVEDTTERRTYFVKVGDELNGLTIREISAKGVVVTYEGEELLLQ